MLEDYFNYTDQIFDSSAIEEKQEALAGIRVLDLTHVIFGPSMTKWLSSFGAEVIKVEEPYEGDLWRVASYWAKYWKDSSPFFQILNTNKYFVGIDLKKTRGKELVLKLAKECDVVVENFRSGLAEAWGIGYTAVSQVNPKIIYASCSGYGQWGPMRFFPSWDLIAQSRAGVARLTGLSDEDTYKLQDYYGDFLPSLFGLNAILGALNYKERTGKGQYIDITQVESLMRMMHQWSYMDLTGEDLQSNGNIDAAMAPSGIFKTCDEKFISIAIATDEQFIALMEAMNREDLIDDIRFKETFERLKPSNADAIHKILEAWVKGESVSEIIDLAQKKGFPAAPVMDDWMIVNDEWRKERKTVIEFNDTMYGKNKWPGIPVVLEKTPGRLKSLQRPIGYHNHYILKKILGLSKSEIKRLEAENVIGYWGNSLGQRPPYSYDIKNDPLFNYNESE